MKYKMLAHITIILCFIIFIAIITYAVEYINKDSRLLERDAEAIVVRKLSERAEHPLNQLLVDCNIPEHLKENSIVILENLGKIFNQNSNKLLCDETLSEILRVEKHEFYNLNHKTWEKEGLQNYLEVFSGEVFSFFEKKITDSKWNELWESIDNSPKNEDEWIDFIVAQNICELLQIFSPMISQKRDGVRKSKRGRTKLTS